MPGPGGWGALLVYGDKKKQISGGEPLTTNNRMELMAAIMALETLKRRCVVDLWTDSQYVRQGITSWLYGWKANGWKTAAKRARQERRPLAAARPGEGTSTRCTGTG